MAKRYLLKCYYLLVLGIVCTTFFILSARFIISNLSKSNIESQLSDWVGLPVTISKTNISWSGYKPVIHFSGVKIGDVGQNKHPVAVHNLLLSINLWQSIYYQKVQPKRLLLDDATIYMHLSPEDELNLRNSSNVFNKNKSQNVKSFLQWFLRQKEANIRKVHIDVEYNRQHFPIELASVHFVSQGEMRSISIRARSINNTSSQLKYVGQFKGDRIDALSGHWYLSLKKLPLSFLDHHIEVGPIKLMDGLFSTKVWGYFDKGKLTEVHAVSDIDKLLVQSVITRNKAVLDKLAFVTTLHRGNDSNQLASNMHVSSKNKQYDYHFKINESGNKLSLDLSHLALGNLRYVANFLGVPLPGSTNGITSRLDDISLTFKDKKLYTAQAAFKQTKIIKDAIEIANLAGTFYVDPKHKQVNLLSKDVVFSSKNSSQSVALDELFAKMALFEGPDESVFNIDYLFVKAGSNQLHGKFSFKLKDSWFNSELDSRTRVDFNQADFLVPIFSLFESYHPSLKWFSESVKRVGSLSGDITTHGTIGKLLSKNTPAFLEAKLRIHDLDLKYHSKWPEINDIDADIELSDSQLNGLASSLKLGSQRLKNIPFSIDSLFAHNNYLHLKGEGNLSLGTVRNYLFKSPIKSKLELLNKLEVKRAIKTNVQLDIPLSRENKYNRVLGKILLDKHDIRFNSRYPLDFYQTNGVLNFDEHGVTTGKVFSTFMNGPIGLTLQSNPQGQKGYNLFARGKLQLPSKETKELESLSSIFSGSLAYKADLSIKSPNAFQFKLYDLAGDLTNKLNLSTDDINQFLMGTQIYFTSDDKRQTLKFSDSNRLQGSLSYKADGKVVEISNGMLSIGKSSTLSTLRHHKGINVDIDKIRLADWIDVIRRWPKMSGLSRSRIILPEVSLNINQLDFNHYRFNNLHLLIFADKNTWRILIKSPDVSGRLFVKQANNSWHIKGHLRHLNLTNIPITMSVAQGNFNGVLPTVNLSVDDFSINNRHLGQLQLNTQRSDSIYILKNLELSSDKHSLYLKGLSNETGSLTSTVYGNAKSIDLSQTLKDLGIHPVIGSKRASVTFNLNWQGKLQDFSFKSVSGRASIDFRNGRITELSKEAEGQLGLGKLISILSLQTLPRRLVLDFSDLAYKGFSYDVLKGHFNINKGIFTTKKLFIDGPVAYVEMIGDINVSKKQYAMKLHVSPHITASLPVVATIAGGPIAGIFTWIASKIVNQGMQKITGYSYSLQGPWDKPELEQIRLKSFKAA